MVVVRPLELEVGTVPYSFTVDIRRRGEAVLAISSINGDTTPAQIIAVGQGLNLVDAGATHTLSIDATVALNNQDNTFIAGGKQTMFQDATTAGLNLGSISSDPSGLAQGDIWFHSSQGRLKYRQGAVSEVLVTIQSTDALINKTIDGDNNTISNLTLGAEVTGNFTDLADIPVAGGGTMVLQRNAADTAYEWIATPTGGGGTSFIGFTADANLNMGFLDILNIKNMVQETAVSTTLIHTFFFNTVGEELAGDFIGEINFDADDVGSTPFTFAQIQGGVVENDVGNVQGRLNLNVIDDGNLVTYIEINGDQEQINFNEETEFFADVDFNNNDVTGADFSNTNTVSQGFTYNDGIKQTFNPSPNFAGINVGDNAPSNNPAVPENGDIYYNGNPAVEKFRVRQNNIWAEMVTDADILDVLSDVNVSGVADNEFLYRSGGNWIPFPVGANDNVLTWVAGAPIWQDPIAGVSNVISQLNTSITVTDTGADGLANFVVDGTAIMNMSLISTLMGNRFQMDLAAATFDIGGNTTLDDDGNLFKSFNTVATLNGIDDTNWQPGSVVYIQCPVANATGIGFEHDQTVSAPKKPLWLINEADFTITSANANQIISFMYDGTYWVQQSFGELVGGGGSGDVVGPGSSTDNAIAIFNLDSGKLIQQSGSGAQPILIDDNANMSGIRALIPVANNSFPASSVAYFQYGNNGQGSLDFEWNILTGNHFRYTIQGAQEYDFDNLAADFKRNDIDQLGAVIFSVSGAITGGLATDPYIEWDVGLTPDALKINVPSSTEVMITVNDFEEYTFTSTVFNGNGNVIQNFASATLESSTGGLLTIENTSSNPGDSTDIGYIRFDADTNGGGTATYAEIRATVADETSTTRDGELGFWCAVNEQSGPLEEFMVLNEGGGQGVTIKKNVNFNTNNLSALGIIQLSQNDETISSGVITAERTYVRVLPQSGSSDNLDTINGGTLGDIIILGTQFDSDNVNVTSSVGNIFLAGDAIFTLDNTKDSLTLIFNGDGWIEVARSDFAT